MKETELLDIVFKYRKQTGDNADNESLLEFLRWLIEDDVLSLSTPTPSPVTLAENVEDVVEQWKKKYAEAQRLNAELRANSVIKFEDLHTPYSAPASRPAAKDGGEEVHPAVILIRKHLENWDGLSKASIQHFAESGKVSGSLFLALIKLMEEYANSRSKPVVKGEIKWPTEDQLLEFIKNNRPSIVNKDYNQGVSYGIELAENWLRAFSQSRLGEGQTK